MTSNMINSRFKDMIKHRKEFVKIIDFVKKNRVVTSGEVSSFLKISWNTADSWLKELALQDKIIRIKKEGGLNLWLLK